MEFKTATFQAVTDLIPVSSMRDRSPIRRLWWHVYELVQPRGMSRVPVGRSRMLVDTADSIISWCLLKHGIFEPRETEALRAVLRPGMTFVDCGANIGYYTLIGADIVGPSGSVISFEPVPSNYNLLVSNIASNGYTNIVTSHAVALGAANSDGIVYLDRDNQGAHSMHVGNVTNNSGSVAASVRCMDDMIGDQRVDVIKMDTQGAEPDILVGARRILTRDKPILFLEWWPWGLRGGRGVEALASMLESLGYRAGTLNETKVESMDWKMVVRAFDADDPAVAPTLICTAC